MSRPIPPSSARVRMYRQGLGDCLLVTLPGEAGGSFHMLVDCGLHMGAPNEAEVMERVARDIAATTGGRLDLVVVSHDHWSQVSGFHLARRVFDDIAIGEVWLSWIEDPTDSGAARIVAGRDRDLRGLRTLANRLVRSSSVADERSSAGDDERKRKAKAAMLAGLNIPLAFFGPEDGAVGRRAIEYLKDHPSGPRVRYPRVGGSALGLPGSAGARARVLGPSTAASPPFVDSSASLALFAAAAGPSGGEAEDNLQSDAFDARYRVDPKRAKRIPLFRRRYLPETEAWRRVDQDWMAAGSSLALRLDGHCNNLSLALAIEVELGGAVLLLPGDARTGEWTAWGRLRLSLGGPDEPALTGADLLARTVLYKVGHHGAAGAGPGAEGLNLMTHPDLVALLSVDQDFAEKAGKEAGAESGWRLPDPGLVDQLLRASRGRLLRTDRPFPERSEYASAGEWRRFRESVVFDPDGLFIDVHLRR